MCKVDNLRLESLLSSCQDEISLVLTQLAETRTKYDKIVFHVQVTNEDITIEKIVYHSRQFTLCTSAAYNTLDPCILYHLAEQLIVSRPVLLRHDNDRFISNH
jgi:hypothetical protein